MKLIGADTVFEIVDRERLFGNGDCGKVRDLIKDLPEAIVRCKDCIHDNDCAIQDIAQTGFNFFCGCAERGTNEQTDLS